MRITVERLNQSIMVKNIQIKNKSLLIALFNCALMEKFGLKVCPAHEGGVYGGEVELVNLKPIGLKNNLQYFSKKAEDVLLYYEELLKQFFCEGVFCHPLPSHLFTDDKSKYAEYFLSPRNLTSYFSMVLWQTELSFNSKSSFEDSFHFFQRVFERFKKETEPSLLRPYLIGLNI